MDMQVYQDLLDMENQSILENPRDIASYKRRAALNRTHDPLSAISDLKKVFLHSTGPS